MNRPESFELPSDGLDAGLREAFCSRGEMAGRPAAANELKPGHVLAGRYRLLEQIGSGGMGAVWSAQQLNPVKRLVAVKLIRSGLASTEVCARFEAERQALALLDHPNIAALFDGGTDEFGRPFFVMELVTGTPITQYCDERKLNARQRLELFVPICRAVHHAHLKGLIHRDLKPSNILVADQQGQPLPKVIDFGVAKSLGTVVTEETLQTSFGAIVGTLEYMSPEQARFQNRDIDARADVYSLGVVLYELLVGTPPFHRDELSRLAIDQVLRVIREVDPPRPSLKLSTSKFRGSHAAVRSCEPAALEKTLRRDLDWLIMKTLEKDRSRRYDSVADLGRDIERFLRGDAIEAAPPGWGYRSRKWLKKNLGWAIIGAAIVLGLSVGLIGLGLGWAKSSELAEVMKNRAQETLRLNESLARQVRLAEEAAKSSQAFADYLVDGFLKTARPQGWQGGLGVDVLVRDALDRAELELPRIFAGQPTAEITARWAHAETWYEQGQFARAEKNLRDILGLISEQPEPARADLLDIKAMATCKLGHCLLRQAKLLDAASVLQGVSVSGATLSTDANGTVLLADMGLAEIDLIRDQPQLVLERLLPRLDLIEIESSTEATALYPDVGSLISAAYEALGKLPEAIALDQKLLAWCERQLGNDHVMTLQMRNNVAQNHWKNREYEQAISLFEPLTLAAERHFGAQHPITLQVKVNLAASLIDAGQFSVGESSLKDLVPQLKERLGDSHLQTLAAQKWLATALMRQNRVEPAIDVLQATWHQCESVLTATHPESLEVLSRLCEALQRQGHWEEALIHREKLVAGRRQVSGRNNPQLLSALNNLATLHWRMDHGQQAIALFREVVEGSKEIWGESDRRTIQAMANLAINLRDTEQWQEATRLLESILPAAQSHAGLEWIADEAILTHILNNQRLAVQPLLYEQELQLRKSLAKLDDKSLVSAKGLGLQANLGANLAYQGKFTEAQVLLEYVMAIWESQNERDWRAADARSHLGEMQLVTAELSATHNELAQPLLQEAEQNLIRAVEILQHQHKANLNLKARIQITKARLRRLYELRGDTDRVNLWR